MNEDTRDLQEAQEFSDPCEIGDWSPKAPPTVVVVFGASGDLCNRKIVPALFNLFLSNLLPSSFVMLGTARRTFTDDEYRNSLRSSITTFSRRKGSEEQWNEFSRNIFYLPVNGENPDDFEKLRDQLDSLNRSYGVRFNVLYYLATASNLFAPIARNLKNAGLVAGPFDPEWSTRLVVEKPFGYDATSARELNQSLLECFAESQILRVDHYLGKETIQNILTLRFANVIFEPTWNNRYINCIQVTVAEDIGVGSRAGYFDTSGIVRDIVQNHVLQVISLLCMEAPASLLDADSIRDEKVKLLKNIRRLGPLDVPSDTIRARYAASVVNGQPVPGYIEEPGVDPERKTETFFAWRFKINNWRWAGVPIFVRVGKRLPKRITEIAVQFKTTPTNMLRGCRPAEPNVLSIRVGPVEGIHLTVNSKLPGPRYPLRPVDLKFGWDSFGVESPEAYERLILDSMTGDATLFARGDEIEWAWRICQPIIDAWSDNPDIPLEEYPAGTWPNADRLFRRNEGRWRDLDNIEF